MPFVIDGIVENPNKKWVYKTFAPIIDSYHDFLTLGQRYHSLDEIEHDFLQPLYGLGQLLLAFAWLPFLPLTSFMESALTNKSWLSTFFSQVIRVCCHILAGLSKLLLTPFTWAIKIPFRAFLILPSMCYSALKAKKAAKIKQKYAVIEQSLATMVTNDLAEESMLQVPKRAPSLLPPAQPLAIKTIAKLSQMPKEAVAAEYFSQENGEAEPPYDVTVMINIIAGYLNRQEVAQAREVSKQFYTACDPEFRRRKIAEYYLVGKRYIDLDDVYRNRRYSAIRPEELLASYKSYAPGEETLLFKDARDAQNFALSHCQGGSITLGGKVPPVFKVEYLNGEISDDNFETHSVIHDFDAKAFGPIPPVIHSVRFFRAIRENIRLEAGRAVNVNDNYEEIDFTQRPCRSINL